MQERIEPHTPHNLHWVRATLVPGMIFGLFMFLVQGLAMWSAWIELRWLRGPSNIDPLFQTQAPDTFQYLGFITMAKDHLLFPNLHAPWATEPAMWNPLFWIAGRLAVIWDISPITALNVMSALMFALAGAAYFAVLRAIVPTRRERVAAIIVAACSLPILMFLFGLLRFLLPSTNAIFLAGMAQFAFTCDGLMRGGEIIGPTQSFGTACTSLALAFTALRLKTGSQKYAWGVASIVLLNGLVHPFEVFVMAPAAIISLTLLERAWKEAFYIGVAAVVGLIPNLYLMVNNEWLRDFSQVLTSEETLGSLIAHYGIGLLAVPYLLLLGARLRSKPDQALLIAWITMGCLALIPGAPFPLHLLDGFAPLTGMLVVRLAAEPKFTVIFQNNRRLCFALAGVLVLLSTIGLAGYYVQVIQDAASPDKALIFPASAKQDQLAMVKRMQGELRKGTASIEDLALAPAPLSMMLVTVPMHSFASHLHLSYRYQSHQLESDSFYAGKLTQKEAEDFIDKYGFRWVVIPRDSAATKYFASQVEAFVEGEYQVFFAPENQMRPYPGIANILPPSERKVTLSKLALDLLGL